MDKITYLCRQIDEVEWSGVLFYSVKGSIQQFDKVELTVEDIYPMNKGTKTFTGYDLDEDLIDFRMSNPKSLAWKIGMIHSHNTMKSYFSGTDMDELDDNSEHHNYYLSLIVNNYGEMVAKVALRGTEKGYECKDENGEDWRLNMTKPTPKLITFDCDIKQSYKPINVEKEFESRVSTIITKSDVAAKKFKQHAQNFNKNFKQNPFKPTFKTQTSKEIEEWNKSFSFDNGLDDVDWNPKKSPDLNSLDGKVKDFARFIMRLGQDDLKDDTMEDALEDIGASDINEYELAGKIVTMYPALFEKYWDAFGEISTEFFAEITTETIIYMEEFMDAFDVIQPATTNLEMMLNRLSLVEDE